MSKTKVKALAVILIMMVLTGCGGSSTKNVSTASIVKSIKSQIEMRATEQITDELITEKYYLNMDDIEEATIENGVINTGLETIAVVKTKKDKTDSVKAAFEKVKEDKKAAAFYPGESEAVDNSVIKVVGDYVGFFIIPDYQNEGQNNSEKAAEIFEKALK